MELVVAPTTLPFTCMCGQCGGPYVRTGKMAPLGEIYIGVKGCLREILRPLELVTAADHADVQAQLAAATARVAELTAECERAHALVAVLEPELESARGEVAQMRDERVAVAAEQARVGVELAELRNGLPVTDLREAVAAVGAAAFETRKRVKGR